VTAADDLRPRAAALARRGPHRPVPAGQVVRVLEILRIAERVVDRLGADWGAGRQVVRVPPEGYPLDWIERDAVIQALEHSHWVQKDAALLLGVSTRAMNYKIQRFNLQPPTGRRWRGDRERR
jgi:hypothetical protein